MCSNNWIKIKPEDSLDLEVVGYYEGKVGTKNEGRFGGFICRLDNGNTVRVGGGIKEKDPTEEEPHLVNERKEFWEKRDELIGCIIEVEFMEWTKDKKVLGILDSNVFVVSKGKKFNYAIHFDRTRIQ